MSTWQGRCLRLEIGGKSHGDVTFCLSGIPAGHRIDMTLVRRMLDRRAPGKSDLTTPRRESDTPVFLGGIDGDGITDGDPIAGSFTSADTRPSDYACVNDIPRPSHADYAAIAKYGREVDLRGGGVFSGRMTAPLTLAGAVALSLLRERGVHVGAHLLSVGDEDDPPFDPVCTDADTLLSLAKKPFPAKSDEAAARMTARIQQAKEEKDSVGGVVECAAVGLPAGIGGELFDGLEGRIAMLLYAIPAVKGVSFGSGFSGARLCGSENNDPYGIRNGKAVPIRNNAGGILGGISTGMPIVCRVAFKPTPSIGKEQTSVSLSENKEVPLVIRGRHDPCVALRAVPVCEAALALALLDAMP